jgi:hypothetical protein
MTTKLFTLANIIAAVRRSGESLARISTFPSASREFALIMCRGLNSQNEWLRNVRF